MKVGILYTVGDVAYTDPDVRINYVTTRQSPRRQSSRTATCRYDVDLRPTDSISRVACFCKHCVEMKRVAALNFVLSRQPFQDVIYWARLFDYVGELIYSLVCSESAQID